MICKKINFFRNKVFRLETDFLEVRLIYIYHHNDFLLHDPGATHPENADRVNVILAALSIAPIHYKLLYKSAPLGTNAQVLLAHSAAHLALVLTSVPAEGRHALDSDTVLSTGSLTAALRGVGAACKGVDDLISSLTTHAFCLSRPPGHHATPTRSMGFCIFNNIVIAAQYAQQKYQIQRVAIVDFDVHHGNGTQDALTGKPGMMYLSTHQSPLYPGTGTISENRPGNICNVPLAVGTGDKAYQEIFSTQIMSQLNLFKPQLLLVSAGFDAHERDPLGGLALTADTYLWLGQQLRLLADKYCGGKLLSVLEGGYNLDVLSRSVEAYLEGSISP